MPHANTPNSQADTRADERAPCPTLALACALIARPSVTPDDAGCLELIAARLRAQGLPDKAAQAAAETRIYSSESGRYGTGLDDATLATDTWKGKAEGDRAPAQLYPPRVQFA